MKKPVRATKELSVKALLALHNKDMKRYVGSLSEEFQGRVSAIAEQFGGLNKKIDRIAEVQNEHTRKLDQHSQILDQHSRTLQSHTMMIGRVMEDVEEIKSGMKEKVDRSEFVKLEKRMVVLETMVFGGGKKVLHK